MKPATLIELAPTSRFMWLIAAICIGSVLIAGVAVAVASNRAQLQRMEASLAAFKPCKAPPQKGDQLLIKVRHDGLNLLITCQTLTDWRTPERIAP